MNPLTHARVVSTDNVPRVLAEMTTEGLYQSSGDWAYTVGLPGKSGVGGGLLAVAPGQLAIAAFSPPLDPFGNSVRGQLAVTQVARELELNLYRARPHARQASDFPPPAAHRRAPRSPRTFPRADRRRPRMTLPSRQERILRRADRALSRSDPHLASMLSIFARLTADERMPAREQLRAPPARAWRVLLWPAAAAYLVIFAAGGGTSAAAACRDGVRPGIQALCPASPGHLGGVVGRGPLPAARRDRPRP